MRDQLLRVASGGRFCLVNCTVPAMLADMPGTEDLVRVDITINDGRIEAIDRSPDQRPGVPSLDLRGGMVLPGFVDVHTHLDKGHIWPRTPNPDGTFMGALQAVLDDRTSRWTADDVRRRMDFSLRCALAHGTVAIRTHIDSKPPQDDISWPVLAETRRDWKGRVELQAVALIGLDVMLDEAALSHVARRAHATGGILGGAMASQPAMAEGIRNALAVADRLGLDIDLHLDETQDTQSDALRLLADAVVETKFQGHVTAGHCCSLARHDDDEARRTIDKVLRAGIDIVSLPMCNLYLQDRRNGASTPRYRGVTLIRELLAAGVNVSVASDNTRDPFYAYGDMDCLEVLRESVRIGHLDHPLDQAPALVTRNPARTMGVDHGELRPGATANLVLLSGRDWSEVLSRPESGRTILRHGKVLDAPLPDYCELDDVVRN